MSARPAILLLALLAPACGPSAEVTGNNVTIPADQAEREYMANGMSGERSSGPSGIADTNLGTTGQSNVAGAAPGPENAASGNAQDARPPAR